MSDVVIPFPEDRKPTVIHQSNVDVVCKYMLGIIKEIFPNNGTGIRVFYCENKDRKDIAQINFTHPKTGKDIYGVIIIVDRTDTYCEMHIQIGFPPPVQSNEIIKADINIYRSAVNKNGEISFARTAGTLDIEAAIKKMFEQREERPVGKFLEPLFPAPPALIPAQPRENPVHAMQARISDTLG